MLTAEQRYWQAVTKARLQGARSLRRWLEGAEPYAKCVADLEVQALIDELDRNPVKPRELRP
jgi:hypothetical protein